MTQTKKKPEQKALVSESELIKIREQIKTELIENEIAPLRERLEIAISAVQAPPVPTFEFQPPTKEQVMEWIAPGCKSEQIISLFIATCNHVRLDPIKKEIYLYEQGKGTADWVIKVDYKVPIAIAQRDPDYLHFKSWVEYLPAEKRPKETDKLNPQNIQGAWCRIYKRSWVKLAQQAGDPTLAYKDHYVPWDTWRRAKKDGNLFGTWYDKGHFYIEKTAIDHCFRLVYPDLIGALPPSTGVDIIEEEEVSSEAQILKDARENQASEVKGKIDRDFSKAPESGKGQGPKIALPQQITAIQKLMENGSLPEELGNKIAARLAEHHDAINGKGGKPITPTEAGGFITEMQAAISGLEQEQMRLD